MKNRGARNDEVGLVTNAAQRPSEKHGFSAFARDHEGCRFEAKDAAGEDTYVLCEINASSVYSIPDEAHDALAATTLRRLADARARWTARRA